MVKYTKSRKVKMPNRKLSEYERFQSFVDHTSKEASRKGLETFEESNDFFISEDTDPLEHYFSKQTRHERLGQLADIADDLILNPKHREPFDHIESTPTPKEPVPPTPSPKESDLDTFKTNLLNILGVNRENPINK